MKTEFYAAQHGITPEEAERLQRLGLASRSQIFAEIQEKLTQAVTKQAEEVGGEIAELSVTHVFQNRKFLRAHGVAEITISVKARVLIETLPDALPFYANLGDWPETDRKRYKYIVDELSKRMDLAQSEDSRELFYKLRDKVLQAKAESRKHFAGVFNQWERAYLSALRDEYDSGERAYLSAWRDEHDSEVRPK